MNTGTYEISRNDSFIAEVIRETFSGCLLSLDLGNGERSPAFAYGNFKTHDVLLVTVLRTFQDIPNRYPLVCVDSVLLYASEMAA